MKQERRTTRRLFGFLLGLVLALGLVPGTSATAYAAESGTVDGFSYTLDDEGTLTLTGSGSLTGNYSGPFYDNSNIKKVIFTEDCGDVTIGGTVFDGSNNITSVEINSTTKVSVGHNAFYKDSGNGAYTVTITSPVIELLGEWPFFNYWEEQAYTLNGKVVAAKGIMTSAESNVTIAINGEAIIYQPAGKVFSGSARAESFQREYDEAQSKGETRWMETIVKEAEQAGCTVTDREESETPMTEENASQVFGGAVVTINIPTYTVTYKVVNGTWSDGSAEDKTESVQSGSKPASVPTGMKASDGYAGGAWDTDPADATITEAKTFTYTFAAAEPEPEPEPEPTDNTKTDENKTDTKTEEPKTEEPKTGETKTVVTTEPAKLAKASLTTVAYPAKGTIKAKWKAVTGAKKYELQWRKAGAKKWSSKTVKGTSFTVKKLSKGTLYEMRVRAVKGNDKGDWSKVVRRWLKGVSSIKAKAAKKGAVKVTWKADSKANAGYQILVRYKNGGAVVAKKTVKAGTTSATVKGLKSGKKAYVQVRPLRKKSGKTYAGALHYAKSAVKVK